MTDIALHQDIKLLVDKFYEHVIADEVLGHIFTETIAFIWEKHIPTMYQFWSTVLLDETSYSGNVMTKHIALNKKTPLTEAHFDRWVMLWHKTVDDHFQRSKAQEAKTKAVQMKLLMQHKIKASQEKGFIQ